MMHTENCQGHALGGGGILTIRIAREASITPAESWNPNCRGNSHDLRSRFIRWRPGVNFLANLC